MFVLRNCRLVKALTEGYEQEYADLIVVDGNPDEDIFVIRSRS